jgi:sec-independent protein translocase protein TatC
MTSAVTDSSASEKLDPSSNPEDYRMTIGEHLEELRRRIVRALLGFGAACAVTFLCGRNVTAIFCRPLISALRAHHLPENIYTTELTDGFMTYVRISLISAGAIAAPWMVYQIWQFIAAGLYPKERGYVTKYVPVSLGLLVTGMVFLYVIVLPMILNFFLMFTLGYPTSNNKVVYTGPDIPMSIPSIGGDPPTLKSGDMWFDTIEGRIKIDVKDESGIDQIRVLPFATEGQIQPWFTLADYIDLVMQLLLIFGLAFQVPLVVMGLVATGIVDTTALRKFRRHVWLGLIILAAMLVPGDVVTAMVALFVPMIALYELGIFLADRNKKAMVVES